MMSYKCKLCKKSKPFVTGDRGLIRDHVKVVHNVKEKQPISDISKKKGCSEISDSYERIER